MLSLMRHPAALLSHMMKLQSNLLLLPWHMFLYVASYVTALQIKFLVMAGKPPEGITNTNKVEELETVIDHMSHREDEYRRKLQALQEALDARTREKLRAMTKTQKARLERDQAVAAGQAREASFSGSGASTMPQPTVDPVISSADSLINPQVALGLHLSVGLAAYCVYWFFLQPFPSISKKLMWGFGLPLLYVYVSTVLLKRQNTRSIFVLYCAAWFLVGFVACHRITGHSCATVVPTVY